MSKFISLIFGLFFLVSSVQAADCSAQLPNGQQPTYTNRAYLQDTKILCFPGMTTLTSGQTRTGLWSAELLTPQRIEGTFHMRRHDSFHPEESIPFAWQAQLSDYVHSGFDRGHIAPSGDMPDAQTMHDSFSLANMAPQAPAFNRGRWAQLEERVRHDAQHQNLYVITGVLFEGHQIQFLKGRVGVPSLYFKMVYSPSEQAASVFWSENVNVGQIHQNTLSEFESQHGINFHLPTNRPLSL